MKRWLVLVGTVLVVTATVGVVGGTDVVALDGDGVPAAAELGQGTDPLATDTDGDGLDDGTERDRGTDPTAADTDEDGLDDATEVERGTDPTTADTDGDDLTDGREVELGTDPTAADTDEDGLADGTEVALETDPTAVDTDGDGLDDATEVDGATDPTSADTDGDGLEDGVERDGPTDPTDPDTDDDGLEDGAEREAGTDPTVADTDGDGLLDGWEVEGETPAGAALPDADPLSKDLYVVVATGADSRSPGDYDAMRDDWAAMPVENPDGSTGVALHVVDRRSLDDPVTFDGSNDDFDRLYDDHYDAQAGDGAGVYHVLVFATMDAGRTIGWGRVGGYFSVADGDASAEEQRRIATHELLHNVVGSVSVEGACEDDPHHYCDGGYLAPTLNDDGYLPEALGRQLSEDGFADYTG